MTIYEKNRNALTATGNRTVTTFPSGLCRIDRTYVCTSDSAATHREALAVGNAMPDDNGSPAIDGAYIFPAPQEVRRADGFTEFQVSAFGRTNTEGKVEFKWKHFTTVGYETATGIAKNKTKTVNQVVLTEVLDDDQTAFEFDESGATTPVLIDGAIWSLNGWYWTVGPTSFESVNFGKFTEIKYVIDAYSYYTPPAEE